MEFKVRLVISEGKSERVVEDIITLDKDFQSSEELGLKLAEAKSILAILQQRIVEHQTETYTKERRCCEVCGRPHRKNGSYPIVFRTLFGNISLRSPRLFHCRCQPHDPTTFSPLTNLLSDHTAPELLYLETKWGSLTSYGMTVKLIKEVLPIDEKLSPSTVRNDLLKVAECGEAALGEEQLFFTDGCARDWGNLPRPDGPITVGIDGGYIRDWTDKKRHFQVMVGRSVPRDGDAKYFGFVQTFDTKPKRRLFSVLESQGMQMNQQMTFLSDGEDTVRDLQMYLNPQSEHLLDWFHITMRITVLGQYAKGVAAVDEDVGQSFTKNLESIKWYLWHGNVYEATLAIEDFDETIDELDVNYSKLDKFKKAIGEFRTYIDNNKGMITNYGERWRYGELISTAFVESTVNAVVSKRFAKKQQM